MEVHVPHMLQHDSPMPFKKQEEADAIIVVVEDDVDTGEMLQECGVPDAIGRRDHSHQAQSHSRRDQTKLAVTRTSSRRSLSIRNDTQ